MSVVARMHFPVFGNADGRIDVTRLELTNAGVDVRASKRTHLYELSRSSRH